MVIQNSPLKIGHEFDATPTAKLQDGAHGVPLSVSKRPRPENHLGLLTDKDFPEDWTRTVLLAAAVGGSWAIENPTKSG